LPPAQDFRQLGPELFVLLDQPVELSLDLVKEGVNLFLVVARPEPSRTELLIFRTSAGVSGISSPRRTWTVFLTTVPRIKGAARTTSRRIRITMKQNHEAEVPGATMPSRKGRDEAAQELQGRICNREDNPQLSPAVCLNGRQSRAKTLHPAEDHPADQDHKVDRQPRK